MIKKTELVPLELQPGFAGLADRIWGASQWPEGARALVTSNGLGCLAIAGANGLDSIIFMTDQQPTATKLIVPKTRADVRALGKPDGINSDQAKGIGVLGAASPEALVRHHSAERQAGVWRLPTPRGMLDIHVDIRDSNTVPNRARRIARHGVLWAGAAVRDKLHQLVHSDDEFPGTDQAFAHQATHWSGAKYGIFPISPVWALDQWRAGIQHQVPPTHVLINGAMYPADLEAERIGTCEVPVQLAAGTSESDAV